MALSSLDAGPSMPRRRGKEIWLLLFVAGFAAANGLRIWAAPTVDETVGRSIRTVAVPSLDSAMAVLTTLGDPLVLVPLTLVGVVYGFAGGARRASVQLLGLGLSVLVWIYALKWLVARPRPSFGPIATPDTGAFPSGHTLGASGIYGMVAVHLERLHTAARPWLVTVAISIALVVGLSRLQLAVHWTTDVLAGWSLGGLHVVAYAWLTDGADSN